MSDERNSVSAASSSCRPSPPPPTPGPMPPPEPPAPPPLLLLIILNLTSCRLTAPTARAAGEIRRLRIARRSLIRRGGAALTVGERPLAGSDLEAAIGVNDDDSSSRPATGRLDPLVTRDGSPNKRRGEGRRRRGRGRALARVWPRRGSRAGAAQRQAGSAEKTEGFERTALGEEGHDANPSWRGRIDNPVAPASCQRRGRRGRGRCAGQPALTFKSPAGLPNSVDDRLGPIGFSPPTAFLLHPASTPTPR